MTDFAATLGLSELQLALGLIGFVLLVVVMVYNALRLRKTETSEISDEGFALASNADSLKETRQEPVFSDAPKASPIIRDLTGHKIDSLIDAIVALRLPESISGKEILGLMESWPKNTLNLSLVEGLANQVAGMDPIWEPIDVNGQYIELQVSIQLANRQGPIGLVDLTDFLGRCQSLANELDAEIDLPPVADLLEEAKQIDQFSAQTDIQLGITIIPHKGLWNLAEIQNVAVKAGFHLARDGKLFQRINGHVLLYSMMASKANFLRDDLEKPQVEAITLLLDLPKVPQELSPFEMMLADAHLLAEALGGHLVDDAGRPLVDDAVRAINTQLLDIYVTMASQGIPAGSLTAHRLFS